MAKSYNISITEIANGVLTTYSMYDPEREEFGMGPINYQPPLQTFYPTLEGAVIGINAELNRVDEPAE